ncbi:MAG TPA: peptidoglycan DD-metalloendopeptidase family protein, partial [Gammaproteobacteria bacterium]
LPWPARGNIMNHFGDSRRGSDLLWQGLRISAPKGSEVRAISHGRVAFADWLPGFGLLMILDHNDGYMSLYGHNETLYKEAGNWVQPGEIIATVGNSGGEQQAVLYFEIRHQGKPVDPQKWCCSLES